MIKLNPDQESDLRELTTVCQFMQIELVIIGATAYRLLVDDPYRTTQDVDIAVAVDLDAFPDLILRLNNRGWHQSEKQEHRWRGACGAIIDLVPAGVRLRAEKQLIWPGSGMTMSLIGFDHVFSDSVAQEPASGLILKVIPLQVFALLKIAAFLEGREQRDKDLRDIGALLERYEVDGERRYGDEVYDSGLGLSYDEAGAFLLGLDLSRLCTMDEADLVQAFLNLIADSESQAFTSLRRSRGRFAEYNELNKELKRQVQAFVEGFRRARQAA
jgi:predicted nucleotidyltransferase